MANSGVKGPLCIGRSEVCDHIFGESPGFLHVTIDCLEAVNSVLLNISLLRNTGVILSGRYWNVGCLVTSAIAISILFVSPFGHSNEE